MESQPPHRQTPRPAVTELLAGFKDAAKTAARAAERPAPGRKKKITGDGKDGGAWTAGAIAGDYLKLCRDPFSDLQRWIDEDKKTDRISVTSHGNRHDHHERQRTSRAGNTKQLLRQTLREVSGRVGKGDDGGENRRDLPAQSRAGTVRPLGLQQVSPRLRASLGNNGAREQFQEARQFASRAPPPGSSPGLARIGEDGHRELASCRAEITRRFASRIEDARRTACVWELALIVEYLRREQEAEIAAAAREALAKMRAQQERHVRERLEPATPPAFAASQTAPPQLRHG
jgi:hypothetical protein